MIINFGQNAMAEGIIVFPDWDIATEPRQDPIINQVIVGGLTTTGQSVGGVADQEE